VAIKKEIDIKVNTEEAVDGIDKLTNSVDKLNDEVVDGNKKTADGLKGVQSASSKAIKGFRGMGLALKAVGIGLLLEAFALFKDVLGQNQKTLDFATTSFNFMSIAVNDLIENIDAVVGWFGKLGSAVGAVFKGQFGVAAVILNDAIDDLTDYTEATVEASKSITDLGNRAAIAAAQNQGLIEKYDRQAEKLRQIRDDDLVNINDRIDANKELGEVLQEQEDAMLRNVNIILQSAQAEYDRNKNIENEVALIEARNEKLAVLAQIEGFRSEQLINTNSLLREKNDLQKEEAELLEKQREEGNELLQEYLDEEVQIEIDAENRRLERAEKERVRKEKESADAIALKQKEEDGKFAIANQGFNLIGMLAKKGSAVAKAAAIAGIVAEQAKSISSTISNTVAANAAAAAASPLTAGQPFVTINTIQAALGIASGVAQATKSIKAITSDSKTAGGGSVRGGGGGGRTAPSFNLVQGTQGNQIADNIAGQNAKPAQAFVVSGNVTSQQELDRNANTNASF